MAISQNNIIGRSSGSVGDITFQKWKLLNVFRGKPSNQYNPKTPDQLAQRRRFKGVFTFYKACLPVLSRVYWLLKGRNLASAAFISKNISLFSSETGLMLLENAGLLFLGDGALVEYRQQELYFFTGRNWVFTSIVYEGVDFDHEQYRTVAIFYSFVTGRISYGTLDQWNGRNAILSDIEGDVSDVVGCWSITYSLSDRKTSKTIFCLGYYAGDY
jgi:hypothetical protein